MDMYTLRKDAVEFSMGYCGPDNCFYKKDGNNIKQLVIPNTFTLR